MSFSGDIPDPGIEPGSPALQEDVLPSELPGKPYVMLLHTIMLKGLPGGSDHKECACNAGDPGSIPGLGSWRREWEPTPVSLPGEFQGQRSLAGYSPWGHKELDTTDQLTHRHTL